MRRVLIAATALAGLAATCEIAASGLWAYSAGRAFEPLGWWHATAFWSANWWCQVLLTGSAALPVAGAVGVGWVTRMLWRQVGPLIAQRNRSADQAPPPVERSISDNHGHARFGTRKELVRDFTRPARGQGILIGAVDRTGTSPLLFNDPNAEGPAPHCLTVSGPGGGKSTSSIHRLDAYNGPRVALDPSNEIGPIMTETLERRGCKVYTIGPGRDGINVLDWLDPANPDIDADVTTATGHIFDEKGAKMKVGNSGDPFWDTSARMMLNCLLSHTIYAFPGTVDLNVLRALLSQSPEQVKSMLNTIADASPSRTARFLANQVRGATASERTWGSMLITLGAATQWMSNSAYTNIVSGNSLKTRDILDPETVVFVNLPLRTLIATPAIGRAVMGSLFNAVIHADGAGLAHRVLFELDEGALLGGMDEIELCYISGRKYGAIMHLLLQSDSQLTNAWGKERADIIRSCCSWTSYNSIQDPATAERLSKAMGTHGVMARSTGDNTSSNKPWGLHMPSRSRGNVENEHEIKRNLCNPDEILRSPSERMWVLAQNRDYVVDCVTAPYYRYPAIANKMNSSRFNISRKAARAPATRETTEPTHV